jgi:hypothetical protein
MADIQNATILANGHLVLVLSDGSTIDAGYVRGIPGPQGERGVGAKGDPGEPGPTGTGVGTTQVQNSVTLGATTTAPTGGTRTAQRIEYQTLGDGVLLNYKLGMTGATAGAGDYLLSLPTGVAFNTTYNPVYTGTLWASGVAAMAPYFIPTMGGLTIPGWWTNMIMIVPYDSTRFRVAITGNGAQDKYAFWSTSWYAANSDLSLQLQFEIWK